MAYFDNAATTFPKPECVYDFMDGFYRRSGGNAGRGHYKQAESAGKLIDDTRTMVRTLLHCPVKQVIFEPTATISLNIEATQKALKIANTQMNKQQGVKFYWRKDQDPSAYYSFREDKNANIRRSVNDICQQELKNAVCMTLLEKGRMKKEDLIKATIRTMGYARSSNVLISAVERGLKYAQKTGEIVEAEEKNVFEISR